MPHVYNVANSPSHVDPQYQLSLAILSRQPFQSQQIHYYPDPTFKLLWHDGKEADLHHKALQHVTINGLTIANTQMLPIRIWGYDYTHGEGAQLAEQINHILQQNLTNPLIFCGDFNFNQPEILYHKTFSNLELQDALPKDQATRPSPGTEKKTPDHIFYSPEFEFVDAQIIQTNSDHYLCFSKFSI